MGKQWKQWQAFIFLGSRITADGDYSHEVKRRFLLVWKSITNLDSIFKSRDIPLPTKIRLVSSVQSLSRVWLFATPWTVALQASLSITNSWSLLKLIESAMPSNHLILCRPLLLLPSIFPSIRVSYSHQVAKVLEFQLHHHSFQWIFRTDFL